MKAVFDGGHFSDGGNDGPNDTGSKPWRFDDPCFGTISDLTEAELLSFGFDELPVSSMSGYDLNSSFRPTLGTFTIEGSSVSPAQYPVGSGGLPDLPPSAVTSITQGPAPVADYLQSFTRATPHSIDKSLPAPKNTWTPEQEEYLMAAKKNRSSFKAISEAMNERFGVERNPNVLSKKYRAIRDRNIEESVVDQALRNTLPSMLGVLDEEIRRLDPDGIDNQEYNEIRREILRKLPGFVHRLALG
ncbi:hypothetical protein F5Y10DRAFT_102698 [Nemania abortiva]|nr:hypothetical protein F5Y10DRAFT_102698 [Nemania abortiva]